MKCLVAATLVEMVIAASACGQAPPPGPTPKPAEQAATTVQMQATPPPETASRVHFFGNRSFTEKDLRDAVADPLQQIRSEGLSLPLADAQLDQALTALGDTLAELTALLGP